MTSVPPPVPSAAVPSGAVPSGAVPSAAVPSADLTQVSTTFGHLTVLRDEVVAAFAQVSGLVVDATLGRGGHSEALLEATSCRVMGLDRDRAAIDESMNRLKRFVPDRFSAVHANFSSVGSVLEQLGEQGRCAGLVADLGVSSPQLDDASYGMSFRRDASDSPLDMRMNQTTGKTARELCEELSESDLANVIFQLGEERYSRRIAHSIKTAIASGSMATTGDLRHAIYQAIGGSKEHGIDPATRTFQAIRIAVNDELGELDRLLAALPTLIEPRGCVAVISFHSLEDRRVKQTFASALWEVTSKRPIVASEAEVARNPRARSAKLRVAHLVDTSESALDRDQRIRAEKYAVRRARKHGLS